LAPPPETTYKLFPLGDGGLVKIAQHPSLKHKRALPTVAAKSPYAVPKAPVVRIIDVCDGQEEKAKGLEGTSQAADFEEMHLEGKGKIERAAAGFVLGSMGGTGHARTESEGVWAEKARRMAERQMSEERREREKELEAFDFEREEAGRKDEKGNGKEGSVFKGWRVSLFGRSEHAG
jgi:hypothetical protein